MWIYSMLNIFLFKPHLILQVPVSEIVVKDVSGIDALRSLAQKFDPQKLASLISSQNGGLITAGKVGVWVCPEFKNMIQVCRGVVQGKCCSLICRPLRGITMLCELNCQNLWNAHCTYHNIFCEQFHYRTSMGNSWNSWDCVVCYMEVCVSSD